MGLLLVVGAVALAVAAALLRPPAALGVLVATVVLVPGSLTVPGAPGVLTVHRLVLAGALVGVVRRCHRRELPWSLFRPPALVYRLLLVVGLLAIIGVGLLQPATDASAAARNWQALALQVPFLIGWVVLVRACDDLVVAVSVLVVATLASAVVALLEAVTGASYARWWFHFVPSLLASDQAQVLATRGGHVRVRAAADFTLAFAWVTAAVLPLLLVLAAVRRRARLPLLVLGLPVLVTAVVLTYSRTVVVPLVLVVVVLAAVLRERGIRVAAAVVLLGVIAVLVGDPGLAAQFTAAADTGSIDVRVERLPVIGTLVAAHPWTGLGISGLSTQGISATDSSYLLSYAEVGVLGLAALVGVIVSAVGESLLALRSPSRPERLVALGAAVGLVVLAAGTFTFDTFSVPAAAETFWLLAALGLVAQDGLRPPRRVLGLGGRVGAVLAAAVAGLLLRAVAPTHAAQTWQFESLLPYPATVAAATYTGTELRTTFCTLARAALPDATMTCQSTGDAPGQGLLRLQAGSAAGVQAEKAAVLGAAAKAPPLSRLQLQTRGPLVVGKPTGLRTAPGWLPLLVAVWVLPVPGRRRVRR
ncbi:MAG: hypothetical protein QOJ48_2177 [Frankiales bacterium]|nr:hypothetical protein [Frankiales bacterium]